MDALSTTSRTPPRPPPVGRTSQLRALATSTAIRRTWIGLAAVVILASWANVAALGSHVSSRQAADAFTAVNTSVFLALVLGVLLSTTQHPSVEMAVPERRRLLGAQARAAGLTGLISSLVLAGLAAAVVLPLLATRGLPRPDASVVLSYVQREAIAAARLAVLGVAIGSVCRRRRLGLVALIVFLAADAVAESAVGFLRDYGPTAAINAFSDPTHHHALSVATGGLISLGWGLVALIIASTIVDARLDRRT